MAVALRDVSSGSDSTATTNHVLSRPGGTQTGDFLFAKIWLADDAVPVAPAGWIPLYAFGETPGNDSGQIGWWRIAAGGDPSTWTFTSASLRAVFSISAWSGVDPDRPIDIWDTQWANNADAISPAVTAKRSGVAVCFSSTAATPTSAYSLPGSLTSLVAYTSTASITAIAGYKSVNAGGVSAENWGNVGNFDHLSTTILINADYSPTLLPGASAFSTAVLALSPAGYWRLADEYGLTADDSAGSNDGTYAGFSTLNHGPAIFPGLPASLLLGAPSGNWTNGYDRCGGNGTGYVSLPSVNWWSSTPDVYTIMACVRVFDISASAARQTIFGASGTSGKPQLEIESDGTLNMIVEGAFRWDAPSPLSVNTSYFIVFTRNGSGSTFHVYVNGSEVTDASPSTTSQTSGAFVGLIGARTTTTQPWNGLISDVALFTTALSSSDVSNLYSKLTGTTFAGENRFQVPAIIG